MSREVFFKNLEISAAPLEIYRALGPRSPRVLLESARTGGTQGRYSLAGSDPSLVFQFKNGRATVHLRGKKKRIIAGDPVLILKKMLLDHRVRLRPGFPPFAGGAVGFVGYEAKKLFEPTLTQKAREDLNLPWMYFIFLEEGALFDHKKGKLFLFCVRKNSASAKACLLSLEKKILKNLRSKPKQKSFHSGKTPVSSVTRKQFLAMVQNAKEHIRRGDIFQANLSQRLTFPLRSSAEDIYENLKKVNPSAFFGIFDTGEFQILSGSPERLLKLEGRDLETRPIAGTRSRSRDLKKDQVASRELLLNEKERAEHLMLVDLERNDLGRVAEYGSVRVDEFMVVEDYSHVKHIVSSVRAKLKKNLHALDAFCAFFPGGTITGAPKVRAMQIIDNLEPVARGPYTGSLGYFSFTGAMDFNIIIRSLVVKDGYAHLQVGAGIVADSDPQKEYEETLYKAEALLTAVYGVERTRAILRKFKFS